MQPPLLRVEQLTKDFGGIRAVNALDFLLRRNEIVAIIGPNGSGKTTVFNLIVHLYDSDSGAIHFGDPPTDLRGWRPMPSMPPAWRAHSRRCGFFRIPRWLRTSWSE